MTTPRRTVYSDLEKQVFLETLKLYKHIIEAKGTNCGTLREKSEAWSAITNEYNKSSLICTKVRHLLFLHYSLMNNISGQRSCYFSLSVNS